MSYDDVKAYDGRSYTGMRVGGRHDWEYPDGRWEETKLSPDHWAFTFRSRKVRRRVAPEGSGAPVGTKYHWFLLAHQRVRKVDANTYETFMEGSKFKVAHRGANAGRWSSEYPQAMPARERIAEILETTARAMRAEGPERPHRLEPTLDPAVLRKPALRSLDEWG